MLNFRNKPLLYENQFVLITKLPSLKTPVRYASSIHKLGLRFGKYAMEVRDTAFLDNMYRSPDAITG